MLAGRKRGGSPETEQMFYFLFYTIFINLSRGERKKVEKNFLPLTSFLKEYAERGLLRCHMPGHKGKPLSGFPALSAVLPYDITEIDGADSLFEAEGILLAAEQETASLYKSGSCCWSAGGSTLCIQAMLAAMKAENRTVIAGRTVHRAFLNACILLDLSVKWVYPESGGLISGRYALRDFEEALKQTERPCVYVTSPDYTGAMQDIAGLAALCRRYGAPLLVDNAHGAHLAFLEENRHPMALGADLCCDSAHKMLPSLTGGAWLHCRTQGRAAEMKHYMQLFGSTSPSYVIMQSLEAATAYLQNGGAEQIRLCAERAALLRKRLPQYPFIGDDPLHLSIAADGIRLADALRSRGLECEYADRTCLVLLLSPVMGEAEFAAIEQLLSECSPLPPEMPPLLPDAPEQAVSMRIAALSAWEMIPLSEAEGRICGPVQVPCPPAVPIAVSGERLNKKWLALMEFYGIQSVAVMQ